MKEKCKDNSDSSDADETDGEDATVLPPFIHNSNTSAQARQEAKDELIGLTGPKNLIDSILHLQDEHPSFIRKSYSIPFRVLYWSNKQNSLWKKVAPKSVVAIDATGELVSQVIISDNESSHVFGYFMVVKVGDIIVPIAQMISAKQSKNFIKHWLVCWRKSNNNILPSEVVTDNSLALLNGISPFSTEH